MEPKMTLTLDLGAAAMVAVLLDLISLKKWTSGDYWMK
jgi:hypothetical protein